MLPAVQSARMAFFECTRLDSAISPACEDTRIWDEATRLQKQHDEARR